MRMRSARETAALMRAHVELRHRRVDGEVGVRALCEPRRRHGIPVLDGTSAPASSRGTICSGCSWRTSLPLGSIAAGADAAPPPATSRRRLRPGRRRQTRGDCSAPRSSFARAARIDKLALAALDATLRRLHRDPERAIRDVPVLQMLSAGSAGALAARAERLRAWVSPGARAKRRRSRRRARGGTGRRRAFSLLELDGPVVAVTPHREGVDDLRTPPDGPSADRGTRARRCAPARPPHDLRGRAGLRREGRRRGARRRLIANQDPAVLMDRSPLHGPGNGGGPHRPREDRAGPRADGRRHRPPARRCVDSIEPASPG